MSLINLTELRDTPGLAVWKIAESESYFMDHLILDDKELAFLNTFKFREKRMQWLASRVLLKKLVDSSEYLEMGKGPGGKPFIKHSDYHISISHSHEYVAVYVHSDWPVGVDIQTENSKISTLQSKFLDEEELIWIDEHSAITHLTLCWAAKEALYKWYGKGGVDFKKDMRLLPFNQHEKGLIKAEMRSFNTHCEVSIRYTRYRDAYIAWIGAPQPVN